MDIETLLIYLKTLLVDELEDNTWIKAEKDTIWIYFKDGTKRKIIVQ